MVCGQLERDRVCEGNVKKDEGDEEEVKRRRNECDEENKTTHQG